MPYMSGILRRAWEFNSLKTAGNVSAVNTDAALTNVAREVQRWLEEKVAVIRLASKVQRARRQGAEREDPG